jgi:hypothetical protein
VRRLAFGLALLVALVPGCGGHASSGPVDAIRASTATYYEFAAPAWWGRSVSVSTDGLAVAGNHATAVIDVHAGGKVIRSEKVMVQRQGGAWQVVRVTPPSLAPSSLSITGPVMRRPAQQWQSAPLTRAALQYLYVPASCVRFSIAISEVDSNYASIAPRFVGPRAARCASNGVLIARRQQDRWIVYGAGSDPFDCRQAPPGVLRSLFGECWIYTDRFEHISSA